ncbi:MAG: hypothetical protein IJU75_07060 [Clostridia bacterium]|nr:hypothetical protein [Clostridia bacterium]
MKKTIISIIAVLALVLSFAACGTGNGENTGTKPDQTQPSTTGKAPEPAASDDVTSAEPATSDDVTSAEPATSDDVISAEPVTSEDVTSENDPELPAFYGEHVFYATNGAYGIYWQFTISEDSGEFKELHTYYTATEYDGSGAIDTSQNAIKHADFKYEITDGKLKITFANYLADGSQEGSDYWFANLIRVGLDEQYTEDFDFETDHILVVTFGS